MLSALNKSIQYSSSIQKPVPVSTMSNLRSNLDVVLSCLTDSISAHSILSSGCSLFCSTIRTSNSGFLAISRLTCTASTSSSNGYSWLSYACRHFSFISLKNSANVLLPSGFPLIARVLTNIPRIFSVSLCVRPLNRLPTIISSCLLYLLSRIISAERNTIYSVVPVRRAISLILSPSSRPVVISIMAPL
ncbi:hypothetical protein D3C75_691980 [compost metagenome]